MLPLLQATALGKMEDATVGPVLAELMDHIIIAAYGKKLMGQLCLASDEKLAQNKLFAARIFHVPILICSLSSAAWLVWRLCYSL